MNDYIPILSKFIAKTKFDDAEFEWNHYASIAQKVKINLRPLFLNLDFKTQTKYDPVMCAVTFLKEVINNNRNLKKNRIAFNPSTIYSVKV